MTEAQQTDLLAFVANFVSIQSELETPYEQMKQGLDLAVSCLIGAIWRIKHDDALQEFVVHLIHAAVQRYYKIGGVVA